VAATLQPFDPLWRKQEIRSKAMGLNKVSIPDFAALVRNDGWGLKPVTRNAQHEIRNA
jgi:hypothetical protein